MNACVGRTVVLEAVTAVIRIMGVTEEDEEEKLIVTGVSVVEKAWWEMNISSWLR